MKNGGADVIRNAACDYGRLFAIPISSMQLLGSREIMITNRPISDADFFGQRICAG
jgi:hypothetical protein